MNKREYSTEDIENEIKALACCFPAKRKQHAQTLIKDAIQDEYSHIMRQRKRAHALLGIVATLALFAGAYMSIDQEGANQGSMNSIAQAPDIEKQIIHRKVLSEQKVQTCSALDQSRRGITLYTNSNGYEYNASGTPRVTCSLYSLPL
ncbi:MAG: hypothetical protein LIO63_04880 [Akkermansia sp.]|nr:hypothetical protein [Akkermansia sp.]